MGPLAHESNAFVQQIPPTACDPTSQIPLLTPVRAWRVIRSRTGIPVSRATFYRWLNSGRVFSFRLGQKFYVPMPIIDEIVKHCRAGERF
jgi:hypothetical protein